MAENCIIFPEDKKHLADKFVKVDLLERSFYLGVIADINTGTKDHVTLPDVIGNQINDQNSKITIEVVHSGSTSIITLRKYRFNSQQLLSLAHIEPDRR